MNQLTYYHRVHRAIGARTGGEEDQFQRVLPERKLTWIIPAGLVRTDIVPFIDRPHEDIIQVNVHLSIRRSTFVNKTERLSRKLECHRGAVHRGAGIGSSHSTGTNFLYPTV